MKKLSKIFGIGIAVAGALTFGTTTTQAQNLVNGGFENSGGFTANPITVAGVNQGWATFTGGGSFTGQTNMTSSFDAPHSGGFSLLESLNPGNNWNPAGAYQIISGITPGQKYTFNIWALTDTTLTAPNGVLVQLGFETAALGGANSVENPGNTVGINGAVPALDKWTMYSVSATAPAGTSDAIVYAMFQDNNSAVGVENLYFDDAVLVTAAPEPSTLALLGMGLAVPFFLRRRKV